MLRLNIVVQLPTEVEADRMTVLKLQENGCYTLDSHRDNHICAVPLQSSSRQRLLPSKVAARVGRSGHPVTAAGCPHSG